MVAKSNNFNDNICLKSKNQNSDEYYKKFGFKVIHSDGQYDNYDIDDEEFVTLNDAGC